MKKRIVPILVGLISAVTPVHAAELTKVEAEGLIQKAVELHKVNERGDIDQLMKLTHPIIFKVAGGKEKYAEALKAAMKKIADMEATFESVEYGNPTPLHPVDGGELCFLPKTSVVVIKEVKIHSVNFLVAIRSTQDKTWTFLDGTGLRGDPERLRKLFPKLPQDIEIPPSKQEVIPDKENQ